LLDVEELEEEKLDEFHKKYEKLASSARASLTTAMLIAVRRKPTPLDSPGRS
jgi:hypothetical protein